MNGALRFAALALLGWIWLVPPCALANEGARVALVIGNGAYAEAPLKNPVNDARAIAQTLREHGFEVILRENVRKPAFESAIADFGEKLSEGATGLFFFAGHGMQVNGRNFLIPVDAKITAEQRVRLETIDVDVVLDQMAAARAKVSMLILDACRNNPFERRFRAVGGGLAQINAPEGTLIAYATAPGKIAADGDGANGLYTQEFLKAIRTPGQKVEDVFKQVRINVSRASNGTQVPWEASSLTGDFYFANAVSAPAASATAPSMEAMLWNSLKDSPEPADLRFFLRQFPNSPYSAEASRRLAALTPGAPPAAPAVQAAVKPTAAAPPPPAVTSPATKSPLAPQVASLPDAVGDTSRFDGRYQADFDLGGFGAQILMEIEGSRVTAYGYSGKRGGGTTQMISAGMCRGTGNIDSNGRLDRLDLRCGVEFDATINGRFQRDGASGAIVGQTKASNPMHGSTDVRWQRIGAVVVKPTTTVHDLDGTYVGTFKLSRAGEINATFTIDGSKITGSGISSDIASAAICKIGGSADQGAGTAEFLISCPLYRGWGTGLEYSATFAGKAETGNDGKPVLKSTFVTNDRTSGALAWSRQ